MTKNEALKLALEALVLNNAEWKHLADSGDSGDWSAEDQDHYKHTEEAITAIKEALANVATNDTSQERVDKTSKSVHEPVAWMWRCKPYCDWPNWSVSLKRPADSGCYGHKQTEGYEDVPLYTTPPQRKPLTDEEIILIVAECAASHQHTDIHFARAIERAHGIKELV